MKTSLFTISALAGAITLAHSAPTIITTAQGKGADSSVRGGSYAARAFGDLDILRVRNAADLKDARKVYLRFDLASLKNVQTATGAALNLTIAPAEGASLAGKTWTFHVYGLKNGAVWNEGNINWNNAPANAATSAFQTTNDAILLGTFALKGKGNAGEAVSFSSPELLKMIQNDNNGALTLIVSRTEKSADETGSVVHIFAAKESKTLAPPSLAVAFNGENPVVAMPAQTVAKTAPDTPDAPKPLAYEAEIAAFEKADIANAPAKGGVVFVGSSSIGRWNTLKQDFPDRNVINRGFGGSEIIDSVHFAGRIVTPYQPKMVVFYAGSNDAGKGKSPETLLADYQAFVAKVRAKMPDVPIAFIAIAPSPKREPVMENIKKANALIEQFSGLVPNLKFVDIYPLMLDKDGKMRPELYVEDGLHMSPAGYEIWVKAVKPLLPKP